MGRRIEVRSFAMLQNLEVVLGRFADTTREAMYAVEREIRQVTAEIESRRHQVKRRAERWQEAYEEAEKEEDRLFAARKLEETLENLRRIQHQQKLLAERQQAYQRQAEKITDLTTSGTSKARYFLRESLGHLQAYTGVQLDGTSSHITRAVDPAGQTAALTTNEQNRDYFADQERAAAVLGNFKGERWENLSLDDKKNSISQLADYNAEVMGMANRPSIKYYILEDGGDYGGYSVDDNVIYINEFNMHDPAETADTVAHESRHAYQSERARNPVTALDHRFRDNADNYITASRDYEGYQNQLIESDARDYAQGFKDYLSRL